MHYCVTPLSNVILSAATQCSLHLKNSIAFCSVRIKKGQKMPHQNDIFLPTKVTNLLYLCGSKFEKGLCTLNRFTTLVQCVG